MPAAVYNIEIEQGATFQLPLVYKDYLGNPIDISGYTARMQVRRSYEAPTPLLDLTTENNGITLGGSSGTIQIEAADLLTSPLPIIPETKPGVYDLELRSPGGVVTRLIKGSVTITPQATK